MSVNAKRKSLSKVLQLTIFRRDGWLCCWCKRPVIFAPVMKYLELEITNAGHTGRLGYYHAHWTRDGSPLLDELGAVIDHVSAFSTRGACTEENLCTACSKCNVRKSSSALDKWNQREKRNPVKGKYGEPQHWDGLSLLFIVLAKRNQCALTAGEREWLKVLERGTKSALSNIVK
jgi:5-methylcytosine-specific restriction endonuclease McrA